MEISEIKDKQWNVLQKNFNTTDKSLARLIQKKRIQSSDKSENRNTTTFIQTWKIYRNIMNYDILINLTT
jgi:hypothetical protein